MNFGTVHVGDSIGRSLSVTNTGASGAAEGLDATIGSNHDGAYSETVTLYATGSNASGYSGALPDITLTIEANVVPEPASAALLLPAVAMLSRARRRVGRHGSGSGKA